MKNQIGILVAAFSIAAILQGCTTASKSADPDWITTPTKSEFSVLAQCPEGKKWECVKIEKRCKLVCVEPDPADPPVVGCMKWEPRCWLECTAYDCR